MIFDLTFFKPILNNSIYFNLSKTLGFIFLFLNSSGFLRYFINLFIFDFFSHFISPYFCRTSKLNLQGS